MPRLKTIKSLSSLFKSAVEATPTTSETSTAFDATLKSFVSSLDASSPSIPKLTIKPLKRSQLFKRPSSALSRSFPSLNVENSSTSGSDGSSEGTKDDEPVEIVLKVPWFTNLSNYSISLRRKEVSRERKQKWVFTKSQVNHVNKLVGSCAVRLGTNTTLEVFGKLGRETGIKEFNALMKICIEKARTADDESIALEQMSKAYEIFLSMKEQGFSIEEETYGQFLLYLIDMSLVEEFHLFANIIKDSNPSALARLGYYEMLLYIRVNDEEKIREFCDHVSNDDGNETIGLRENYLLALCGSDRKDNFLQLLELVDITKMLSLDQVTCLFESLGRLSLESYAKKFLFELKEGDHESEIISALIFSYATSIPHLAVEDVVLKFKNLHTGLEMTLSSTLYAMLIEYSCALRKVHVALDLVDQMCKEGLSISIDTVHSLLNASEESFEFNLVQRIYSLIRNHNLKPNHETFRSLISLSVKMKDFTGAYDMLNDLMELNLTPTSGMYNAIMAGYFREKNIPAALNVLKQLKFADLKPDSITYSYLISNGNSEEKITEYYEEMKASGVQASKQIFMALINAYAACGQFEKAKQVLLDKEIPLKNLNEIKSVLVSALASHNQMSDALDIYEEIKGTGSNLEQKAALFLIEHLQSEGELSRLLGLLEELRDSEYFVDGCYRIILYCIRNKHLSSAVDLLKQLKDRFCDNEFAMEVLFDEAFSLIAEMEPVDTQIGLDLLHVIKNDFGACPSRKCLDFLLSACAKAKNIPNLHLIWKEYEAAGLPYNVNSYLRMYQALLASDGLASAKIMLKKIPKDDPHVLIIIKACQKTYMWSNSVKNKKSKGQKQGMTSKTNQNSS